MSHTPHDLADDFPQHAEKLPKLRQTDHHFAKLASDYDEINEAVHKAETDLEPTSDDHLAQMRKERMLLKDQIAATLARA